MIVFEVGEKICCFREGILGAVYSTVDTGFFLADLFFKKREHHHCTGSVIFHLHNIIGLFAEGTG